MSPDPMADLEPPSATEGFSAGLPAEPLSLDVLTARLYADLRRLAQSYLRDPSRTPTLQATALVHETFLRLRRQQSLVWRDRGHFLAIAALCMRRIVLDAARRRAVRWRHVHESSASAAGSGDAQARAVSERQALDALALDELLAVGEAVERLRHHDPELARVVELRFFVGLEHAEIARQTGVSARTVKRRWRTARRWLYHALRRTTDRGGGEWGGREA
ncbi:MAG: ECF-type sigma factor [Acidobacteriota bacterium]